MKSWKKIGLLVIPAVFSMAFPAFAGQWEKDSVTWKYQEDDGSYLQDTWKWIDGNGDGIAECYHFDANGHLDQNTVVDNWIVDKNGAWVAGGNVQQWMVGASQEEIGEIYVEAAQKSNAMNSMDADISGAVTMSIDGEALKMLLDMNVKANGVFSGDLELLYDMAIKAEGETLTMTMFYLDGYMYMEMDGEKIKMPMDMESAMQQSMVDAAQMELTDPLYGIENMKLYYNGSRKIIAYDMNSGELNSAVQGLLGASGMDMSTLGYTYEISNTSGTIEIDENGNPVKESISMDMAMDFLGITMVYDIDLTIDINNPGQPVVISFPSTEGYVDLMGYADMAV